MTRKVMRLVNPSTGEMECKVCGEHHFASLKGGGYYIRGSWQCQHGCKLEDREPVKARGKEGK